MEAAASRWRIVVGVDGSDDSVHALAWARDEAALREADLHVVHAWAPPVALSEIAAMATPVDADLFEEAAADVLADSLERIGGAPVAPASIGSRLVRGHPPSVLLAEGRDADLLVVGSRGRGGFAGLLLGSVSQQCLHHAERPIAVVPRHARLPGAGDVVVGVDGSECSASALRWAVDEAAARGALLAVVHAGIRRHATPPEALGLGGTQEHEAVEHRQRQVADLVDGSLARAAVRPPQVEVLHIDERPASALLERAEGAGLLVVGSRGRGGFAGLLLGSVSQHCVHHAPCAVVVVPRHS